MGSRDARAAWPAALLVLALAACSDASGGDATDASAGGDDARRINDATVEDAPSDGPGPDADEADADTSGGCASCVAPHCLAELALCARSSDCVAIVDCAGGAAPTAGCVCPHPAGAVASLELTRCEVGEACSPDCSAACAASMLSMCALFEAGVPDPTCDGGAPASEAGVAECSTCVGLLCDAEASRCGAGSDCVSYETCALGCRADAPSCVSACQTSHPEGYGLAQALGDCETGSCSGACGVAP